jgi:hypothetical protein
MWLNVSFLQLSSGVEWRQKLDTQRGAVLANELRNNACKLAKWTVQALLAGSDQIKFGYVQLLSSSKVTSYSHGWIPGRGRDFLFTTVSTAALGPIHAPI